MPLCVAWREQRIQLPLGGRRSNPHLPVFEQRRRTGRPAHQGPGGPDARVQALLQRPADSGKIIKGQFGLSESFATAPLHVWYNVLAT